jgi:hypothetical protein
LAERANDFAPRLFGKVRGHPASVADSPGLALAKAARALNPKYKVIYASRNPFQIPDRDKVGALRGCGRPTTLTSLLA